MRRATPNYILQCPVTFDWVEYKGETMFAGINYERSIQAKRPMIDLFYCATKAMNNIVIKTVQYNKKKFKPSSLCK
jgi:hypothetical protein